MKRCLLNQNIIVKRWRVQSLNVNSLLSTTSPRKNHIAKYFVAPLAICLTPISKPPVAGDPDMKAGRPNASFSCTSMMGKGHKYLEHLIRINPNHAPFLLFRKSFISACLKDLVFTLNTSLISTTTQPSICMVCVLTTLSLWESLAFFVSLLLRLPKIRASKSEGLEAAWNEIYTFDYANMSRSSCNLAKGRLSSPNGWISGQVPTAFDPTSFPSFQNFLWQLFFLEMHNQNIPYNTIQKHRKNCESALWAKIGFIERKALF